MRTNSRLEEPLFREFIYSLHYGDAHREKGWTAANVVTCVLTEMHNQRRRELGKQLAAGLWPERVGKRYAKRH